ncbi:MAG: hypothetical protein Q8P67_08290, partial [archaeon]|nr:hypothetical protein [archaeon]
MKFTDAIFGEIELFQEFKSRDLRRKPADLVETEVQMRDGKKCELLEPRRGKDSDSRAWEGETGDCVRIQGLAEGVDGRKRGEEVLRSVELLALGLDG